MWQNLQLSPPNLKSSQTCTIRTDISTPLKITFLKISGLVTKPGDDLHRLRLDLHRRGREAGACRRHCDRARLQRGAHSHAVDAALRVEVEVVRGVEF